MSKALARRGLAVLAAVMLLVGCSAAAHAVSGVTFSPGGSITQTGTFRALGFGGATVVECPITLSGSFATTLVTVGETTPTVGSYTGLTSGTCARGSIRTVLNLPAALRLRAPARTAPAGSVGSVELDTNVGIRVRLSTGEECLLPSLFASMSVEALGDDEYALGRTLFGTFECPSSIAQAIFDLAAPSPRQVVTFLTGNEVIDGFTPRPLVFKTVRAGEVAQRTVTIGSSAGGRIEEVVVTTQRYFAITDPNECRGRTLAARGTCDINVLLSAPTESGRTVTDRLTVTIAGRRFEGTLRAST